MSDRYEPLHGEWFSQVQAETSLPSGSFLYEANVDLTCAGCGATIPANSYFGRKRPLGKSRPYQHCRVCLPIMIYTDRMRAHVAAQEEEYLYVHDQGEQEGRRA